MQRYSSIAAAIRTATTCIYSQSLLIWLFTLVSSSAYAQVPPSPNAASQAKFASMPVNLYTGTPSIQVPLLTLPGRHMNVPIGLSYHAGGFKVQEIAGPVGLGWALNAGGVITRTVQGSPDDSEYGYSGPNAYGNVIATNEVDDNFNLSPNDLFDINDQSRDGEPDMYYFNVMGRTGRFTLDAQRNAVLMPYQDVDIKVTTDTQGRFVSWVIKTEDGMVYRFGADESARETTFAQTLVDGEESSSFTYTSSWYLSEASSPSSSEVLTFSYESGGEVTYDYYNFRAIQDADDCTFIGDGIQELTTRVTLQPSRRLKSISSALGAVDFRYLHDRPDVAGQALTQITLSDKTGQLEREITLRYGELNGCYLPDGTYADFGECKRLRLDRVEDTTPGAAGAVPPLYTFDYNTDTYLPDRQYGLYDDWGYANGKLALALGLPETAYAFFRNETIDGVACNIVGANATHQVDARWSKAFLLERITQATGGYTTYDYEGHFVGSNPERRVGGARVKAVRTYDGRSATPSTKITYDYHDSGQSSGESTYGWVTTGDNYRILVRYAQSVINLFDLNSVAIGYKKVSAVRSDGSRTTYRYTNFDQYDDKATLIYRLYDWKARNGGVSFLIDDGISRASNGRYNQPPYPPNESRSWQRGLPTDEIHLSASDDTVQSTYSKYILNRNARATLYGLKVDVLDNYDYEFRVGRYRMVSQPVFLEYKIEKTFDQSTPSRSMKTRTDYVYNEAYLTLRQTKTTNSEGQEVFTDYQRARDVGNNLLIGKHMHSQVLNQSTRIGGVVRQQATTTYTTSNNLVVPTRTTLYPDGIYGVIWEDYLYDTYGNVIQSQRRDDLAVAYLWGYNHCLKVAEVVGKTYAQATAGINQANLQSYSAATLTAELNKLRGAGRLVTTYTYDPLTGMTTETDPAGITTYYEYDGLNRLQYVRDHQQRYVERYQYHYQGQPHP